MSHYFENDSKLKSEEKLIFCKVYDKEYKFYVDNGVFSKKGLDFGTRSLLESLDLEKITGNVLDLGCGYGPIGIILALNTNANIDMIDINKRSLKLANKNTVLNNVKVNIFESNMYEKINKKYDYIITNPPIRVGKKILYEILENAKYYLNENGHMICVIHKDQGAKTVVKMLEKHYLVKILNKNKGFYIIDSKNN